MSLDCDDAMLLIAAQRTLTGREETHLGTHLADCAECRALRLETTEDWRWVARMPQDAFDDPDLLVFPVVDPIVFQAGKVIASGGMGRITRVTDRRLGREVALKESLEGTLRSRFEREAAITARLQHPSIVPIYEAGSWPDGSLFYTMRLVDGVDLAAAIGKTETFAERIALLPHVLKVTEALAYAHARKIIHRDLKPANVLVGAYGETVVIDWGIAKELGRTIDDAKLPQLSSKDGLTRSGTILGTPCFMAPEQARSEAIDERADVYALGALLYNLLAGEPPYWDRFKSAELIIEYSILHPPTPIQERAPEAPADLCAIVERAMARAPADRYRDAREMAEELRRFEAGQLIAREYTLRELAARWLAKHRTPVLIASIALSVLAVIAVIAVINVRSSRDAEATARKEAETSLVVARVSAAAVLEEQARSEIRSGDRARGLIYASAAYGQGRDTPSLRYLLAVARRDVVLHTSEIGPPALTTVCGTDPNCVGGDTTTLSYDLDGNLVLVEATGRISIWSNGKQLRMFALPAEPDAASLTADGRRAVVLMKETTLAAWDVVTGTMLWSITDPLLDGTADVRFDPTGKYIVARADNPKQKKVAVRDAATGAVVAELAVGNRSMTALVFSSDGARVAACNKSGAVRVWEVAGFTPVAEWLADPEPDAIAFAGRDRIVIDSSFETNRNVSIWELGATPQLVKLLPVHRGAFATLAATPDGSSIVTSDERSLRLWSRDGELLADSRIARTRFFTLRFTPTAILGQAVDSRLFVFERDTLEPRAVIDAHDGPVDQLVLDPTRTRIATVGLYDQRVHEWSMPGGPVRAQFASGVAALVGDRIAVATPTGIELYRADTGAAAGTTPVAIGTPERIEVAGETILVAGSSGQFVIDRSGARRLAETTDLNLSHDGHFALAKDSDGDPPADGLRVWNVSTGELSRTFSFKWDEAVIVRDTVVSVRDRRVSIHDIATGRKTANVQLEGAVDAYELAVSPSGKVLVARTGKWIAVLDPMTAVEVGRMTTQGDSKSVFFGRDDQLLIVVTESGGWAWDIPTTKLQSLIDRRTDAFDSHDTRIAVADNEHLRLWDRTTSRPLDEINVVSDPIIRATFDATGTRILITTRSSAVLLDVSLATEPPPAFEAIANQLPWKLEQGIALPK